MLGARRIARLKQLVAEIKAAGGQAIAVRADVTKRQDSEKMLNAAIEQFGRVDVWINNARLMALAPLDKLKVDEWDA